MDTGHIVRTQPNVIHGIPTLNTSSRVSAALGIATGLRIALAALVQNATAEDVTFLPEGLAHGSRQPTHCTEGVVDEDVYSPLFTDDLAAQGLISCDHTFPGGGGCPLLQ